MNKDPEITSSEKEASSSLLGEGSSGNKTLAMTGDASMPERAPLDDDDDGPGLPMGRLSVIKSSSATKAEREPQLEPTP